MPGSAKVQMAFKHIGFLNRKIRVKEEQTVHFMKNYKNHRGMVQVRVQANDSYQIKRAIGAVEKENGFVLMSSSGIRKNTGDGPRLREFASFRDLKAEKKEQREQNRNKR